MTSDLTYDGQSLVWARKGKFKATSGLPSNQTPKDQCLKDRGPVPEGNYYVPIIEGGTALDDGRGLCNLAPSWRIETIPRGAAAGVCEPLWANWGRNRVRFEPADVFTANACRPKRGGFYLHDSTKGFSHGCIEVETSFFTLLKLFAKTSNRTRLKLKIQYTGGSTYGGTKAP